MGEQLDLAGTVEEDVIVAEALELLLQPLDVLIELFERVEHAAVGAEPRVVVGHDGLERDEIPHVHRRRVRRPLVRRVQVHHRALPPYRPHELLHPVAVRRLPRPRRPDHQLRERHRCALLIATSLPARGRVGEIEDGRREGDLMQLCGVGLWYYRLSLFCIS